MSSKFASLHPHNLAPICLKQPFCSQIGSAFLVTAFRGPATCLKSSFSFSSNHRTACISSPSFRAEFLVVLQVYHILLWISVLNHFLTCLPHSSVFLEHRRPNYDWSYHFHWLWCHAAGVHILTLPLACFVTLNNLHESQFIYL